MPLPPPPNPDICVWQFATGRRFIAAPRGRGMERGVARRSFAALRMTRQGSAAAAPAVYRIQRLKGAQSIVRIFGSVHIACYMSRFWPSRFANLRISLQHTYLGSNFATGASPAGAAWLHALR